MLALTSGACGDIYSQQESERHERAVADSMLKAAKEMGVKGRVFITAPVSRGAHVVAARPMFSRADVTQFTCLGSVA